MRQIRIALLVVLIALALTAPAEGRRRVNNCAHDPIGDVNADGVTDIVDYSALSAAWGKRAGERGFNRRADLDCSGEVDEWDYRIFVLGFEMSWK